MYKILIKQLNKFYIVDFKGLCKMKKIAPKLGFYKRIMRVKQSDRISNAYPSAELVANWFGLKALPVDECDQPSNWQVTMKYITEMYGKKYAKGFERADYPKLRKAA